MQDTAQPLRIQLWSGPRNVSTALMYSFAQRGDTRVVDEPLYAHYLRVSGARHPGRDAVLAAQEVDGEKVVREVLLGPSDRPVLFFKQMAHHLVELERSFLARCANVLLTRDPEEMLPSLAQNLAVPTLRDTGYAMQTGLLRELRALGQDPPVLVARELLCDPRGVLAQLCARLGIPFDERMLSWKPGARPEDGVWSGFEPYAPKKTPFPERLRPLLAECRPHFAELARLALRAS
jgi:hypothetical protein